MAEILMPYAESVAADAWSGAPRLPALTGRTVGLVNNSWRCMNVLADELARLLVDEHGVAAVREERISAAQVLPDDRVTALAHDCDAVVVGIGN